MTSDVPGFSWGIVSALAQSGVKYFATAPNSGDRIGYTLQAWGDKPFYWTSQSGKEKVLTWMAGASYSTFHEGTLSQLGDDKIMKLVRKLDDVSYPYEMFQLPYTLGDNGPPDPTLSDFVRQWNDRYVTPRLILATHEQMFEEFEKRYGSTLPVVQGDFTPYWEDGAASTAAETALSRAAADRLIQGEALWSMLSPASYPAAGIRFRMAQRCVRLPLRTTYHLTRSTTSIYRTIFQDLKLTWGQAGHTRSTVPARCWTGRPTPSSSRGRLTSGSFGILYDLYHPVTEGEDPAAGRCRESGGYRGSSPAAAPAARPG